MKHVLHHLRSVLAAISILALSAGLAFGAAPQASWGLSNAASHAGKTVPVADTEDSLEDGETEEDEESETEEDEEEETEAETTEEDGGNCVTDPTVATEEVLAELNHGSVVCWAAHQTEWPDWFESHGQWVRCWAQQRDVDAAACTEDPDAEPEGDEETADDSTVEAESAGPGKAKGGGQGKANGKGKSKAGRD